MPLRRLEAGHASSYSLEKRQRARLPQDAKRWGFIGLVGTDDVAGPLAKGLPETQNTSSPGKMSVWKSGPEFRTHAICRVCN